MFLKIILKPHDFKKLLKLYFAIHIYHINSSILVNISMRLKSAKLHNIFIKLLKLHYNISEKRQLRYMKLLKKIHYENIQML